MFENLLPRRRRAATAGARRHHFRPRLECLETREVPAGLPTAAEQVFLERLNDARANPAAYGASIGLDLSGAAPSAPLAFDTRLVAAAQGHSQDMSARNYFDHTGSNGSNPGTRLTAAGYPWQGYGESIAAGYATPEQALRGLIIDAGVPDLGHRVQLLALTPAMRAHDSVGIGIVQNGAGAYRNYYTVDSAHDADSRRFLTGVVYQDLNGSGRYDAGEGLGGVTVAVAGAGSVTTWGTGGYSYPLAAGTYTVTASGPGLAGAVTRVVTVGGANARLDFTPSSPGAAPPAPAPAAEAPQTRFVQQAYRTILGRDAEPAGLAYWTAALNSGLSRADLVSQFRASLEFRTLMVRNEYVTLLGREPDPAGAAYYAGQLGSGGSLEKVRAALLGSDEFLAAGAPDATFLARLYQHGLGRPIDPAGAAYYGATLAGGTSRGAVAGAVLASQEAREVWVRQLYLRILHREPDAAGLSYWAGRLARGTPREQLWREFTGSAEFLSS